LSVEGGRIWVRYRHLNGQSARVDAEALVRSPEITDAQEIARNAGVTESTSPQPRPLDPLRRDCPRRPRLPQTREVEGRNRDVGPRPPERC
jgi:hypothetical protein